MFRDKICDAPAVVTLPTARTVRQDNLHQFTAAPPCRYVRAGAMLAAAADLDDLGSGKNF
jgi:hypothetical protein